MDPIFHHPNFWIKEHRAVVDRDCAVLCFLLQKLERKRVIFGDCYTQLDVRLSMEKVIVVKQNDTKLKTSLILRD